MNLGSCCRRQPFAGLQFEHRNSGAGIRARLACGLRTRAINCCASRCGWSRRVRLTREFRRRRRTRSAMRCFGKLCTTGSRLLFAPRFTTRSGLALEEQRGCKRERCARGACIAFRSRPGSVGGASLLRGGGCSGIASESVRVHEPDGTRIGTCGSSSSRRRAQLARDHARDAARRRRLPSSRSRR